MTYEICAVTDVGCIRSNNEDGFLVNSNYAYGRSYMSVHEIVDEPFTAFVMDGVGGSEYGEAAVKTGIEYILNSSSPISKYNLETIIYKMNEAIYSVAKTIDTAATIAGIVFSDGVMTFNIGDSKIFSINKGYLEQISTDDTLSGLKGEEPSEKNEPLLQYLGKQSVIPHIRQIETGTWWLLCTDGLTDMVTIDRIEDILSETTNMQEICDTLVEEAKNNGGFDNITLILIKECETNE